MAKKKPVKRSKTSYQSELAKLKKEKEKALKIRNDLIKRQKEMQEIRELRREVANLKGAGSKRRIAANVGKKLGKDVGRVGWKGIKTASKYAKAYLEREARAQDRDRARAKSKGKKK